MRSLQYCCNIDLQEFVQKYWDIWFCCLVLVVIKCFWLSFLFFITHLIWLSLFHLDFAACLFHISVSVFVSQAGPGSFTAALQDDSRTDLNEVKGHLEIALLEKHFLREYSDINVFKHHLVSRFTPTNQSSFSSLLRFKCKCRPNFIWNFRKSAK